MGKGSAPAAPAPPDYAAATREGILTDVETLPARRLINAAARMGRAGSFTLGGETFNFDFTGVGDMDLAANQAAIQRSQAFASAQNLLDIQDEFGQRFLTNAREQIKASDPIGFALREELGQQISTDLAAGDSVSAAEQGRISQSVLRAQTARGNVRGLAPAVQEVLAQDQFARQRQAQRRGEAAAFLSGTTPLSQFGQLRSAQVGAAPFVNAQIQGATMLDPNAGALAAQFAQQSFGTQANIYGSQLQYKASQGNPWMEGLGMAAGLGGQLGSAAMLCWVARAVYGEDNPRWLKFREWVLTKAPERFRKLYLERGQRIAEMLRGRPDLIPGLREWMDTKIEQMEAAR